MNNRNEPRSQAGVRCAYLSIINDLTVRYAARRFRMVLGMGWSSLF
ncbi:MAG: hypothetical protein NTW85_00590 [Methylococcales bacterium]|nr:hypothetical protein [Methylococcales bacterium]